MEGMEMLLHQRTVSERDDNRNLKSALGIVVVSRDDVVSAFRVRLFKKMRVARSRPFFGALSFLAQRDKRSTSFGQTNTGPSLSNSQYRYRGKRITQTVSHLKLPT
jgi:hypothetical protein